MDACRQSVEEEDATAAMVECWCQKCFCRHRTLEIEGGSEGGYYDQREFRTGRESARGAFVKSIDYFFHGTLSFSSVFSLSGTPLCVRFSFLSRRFGSSPPLPLASS
ncbi:hypothetical protein PIB30_044967 [Stylosanthes scabra]|uniref:Uncharacterized protein n=1 Tax=Stylosanthes scabra TaxID=79078 RepID=A0ABU6THV9_9FABA|nr:hypothetical protein [Stylosanthes scabra]